MLETPEEVIEGLKIILKRFGITNGHIAIEDNKPDAIKLLKEKCEGTGITVDTLKKKYPQGSEKHLIYAVTKRKVAGGKLPADAGVIVVNVDTCTAIARKFKYGTPLMRRIVTVVGTPFEKEVNYNVRIGTGIDYIIEKNGGFKTEPAKVIIGGPMMGVAQFRLNIPVIKGTSGLIALKEKDVQLYNEMPCVRCGKCSRGCPMKLSPIYLALYSRNLNFEQMERYHITDCIECGSCSFVCPSKRNPVQYIRVGKALLAAEKSKGKEKK